MVDLLERHCFSTTLKSRRDWQNVAMEYGRAKTFADRLTCIEWCITTARAEGVAILYAEHAIPHALRWAAQTRDRAAS